MEVDSRFRGNDKVGEGIDSWQIFICKSGIAQFLAPSTADFSPFAADLDPSMADVNPSTADLAPSMADVNPSTADLNPSAARSDPSMAGVRAAVDYLAWVGEQFGEPFVAQVEGYQGRRCQLKAAMSATQSYERTLSRQLLEGLGGIDKVTLAGITDSSTWKNARRRRFQHRG